MIAALIRGLLMLLAKTAPFWRWVWFTLRLNKVWPYIAGFLTNMGIKKAADALVGATLVTLGLAAWGVFLGVFWTSVLGFGIHDLFSVNPLSGAPAGALYLASNAFPLKFAFGISIAFIQWRMTFIHGAIWLSRIVKYYFGF